MNKYISAGVISANMVFGESCKSAKDAVIGEFRDKAKKKDEEIIKKLKGYKIDPNKIISHTNELNTDEYLRSGLFVLKEPSDEDKKKFGDIFKKNVKKIKSNAKYGDNSLFCIFVIDGGKIKSYGIIEFESPNDKSEYMISGCSFFDVNDLDKFMNDFTVL